MRAQQNGRKGGVMDLGARVAEPGRASTAAKTPACQMGTSSRSVQMGELIWEQVRDGGHDRRVRDTKHESKACHHHRR